MFNVKCAPQSVDRERQARLLAETSLQQISHDLVLARQELKQSQELLEQRVAERTAELVASNEALSNANLAKSNFLANMSHEIRTPLTIILCYSEMLKQDCEQHPDMLEAVSQIKQSGDHLLEIINDVLDLSKIEADKLDIERIDCSPVQILNEVAALMRSRAEVKGLTFAIESTGPVPDLIESDPTRLRQILINLVGNAIKFTARGHVRLSLQMVSNPTGRTDLQFEVVDTGIGISTRQIEQLFQPFSQADRSTSRHFGGTGLGLSISKRLTCLLGGDLTVRSTLGTGSQFRVVLPVGNLRTDEKNSTPQSIRPAEKYLPEKTTEPAAPTAVNCKLLLAEDCADSRRLLSKLLTVGGAQVTTAENGEVAVRLALEAHFEGEPFDVILMDMQMPLLDGSAATKLLRKAGYLGAIVALTAHAMSDDQQKCLDAGCNEYIPKPIHRKKLVSLVSKYQRSPASAPNL